MDHCPGRSHHFPGVTGGQEAVTRYFRNTRHALDVAFEAGGSTLGARRLAASTEECPCSSGLS